MAKKLKDFLSESINVPMMGQVSDQIGQVISQGVILVAQSHLVHWNTKVYASHVVLGEFYEELQEAVDSLAEKAIGIGLDVTIIPDFNVNLSFNMAVEDFVQMLSQYRDQVSQALSATTDSTVNSTNDQLIKLQDLIDETLFKLDLI